MILWYSGKQDFVILEENIYMYGFAEKYRDIYSLQEI